MGRNILLLFLVCGIHQVFAARKKSILYLKSGLSRDIKLTEIIYIVYAHTLCFTEYNLIGRAKDCCRSNGARVAVMHNGAAEFVSECEAYCDKTPGCLFFSHSTRWENCNLCSKCDFTTTGNARYYTSWEKAKGSWSLKHIITN